MTDKQILLFDLDGTITASEEGIINSAIYALKRFGIAIPNREDLRAIIGPPLQESFMQTYGLSPEKAREAVACYREYYEVKGIFECHPYEGIGDLLADLKRAGKTLLVATGKPEPAAKRVLAHFNLQHFFESIHGSGYDGSNTHKHQVIGNALSTLPSLDRIKAVMIGDRKFDIEGAKQQGIASIGVLYGYGSREEMIGAGADKIAGTVRELRALLL